MLICYPASITHILLQHHCRDIRRLFGEQFREFVYETNRHHGIGEMLMILGSIITGFSKPIKPEHLRFLNEAILPLHQPDWLAHYHPQLSYCMMQYVQKDPVTGRDIIKRLVKKWPWRNSPKQVGSRSKCSVLP